VGAEGDTTSREANGEARGRETDRLLQMLADCPKARSPSIYDRS